MFVRVQTGETTFHKMEQALNFLKKFGLYKHLSTIKIQEFMQVAQFLLTGFTEKN